MLCVDCEVCFEIGGTTCPGCGSSIWVPLARFLEAANRLRKSADSAKLAPNRRQSERQLLIVARNRVKLCRYIRRAFQGSVVRVLLDQRGADAAGLEVDAPWS